MKKWSKIIEEKRDEIIEAMKEATRKTHNIISGGKIDVEIDENEVWVNSVSVGNSQSESSFNGESFIVKTFEAWEVDCVEGDIDEWSEERIEEEIEAILDDMDFHSELDYIVSEQKTYEEYGHYQ